MAPVFSNMYSRTKPAKSWCAHTYSQTSPRSADWRVEPEKPDRFDRVENRFRLAATQAQSAGNSALMKRPIASSPWRQVIAWRLLHTAVSFACTIVCASAATGTGWCQAQAAVSLAGGIPSATVGQRSPKPSANPTLAWDGLTVRSIAFEGVSADRLAPLSGHLAQAEGAPLSPDNLKASLRRLYDTGLYDTIEVAGEANRGGVDLIFRGTPATFIGTVGVDGATGATMNTQLERACQLEAGTRLTQAKMIRAVEQMRATLEENGYHESAIAQTVTPQPDRQLANISFRVVSGARAHVGKITVTGDSGMSLDDFRRCAHLRPGAGVDHDTVNRALDGVLKHYQAQDRLEADVKLEAAQYNKAAKAMDYRFTVSPGPVVKVVVEGAGIDSERMKHLIPIFEEGSVDDDLLNEGNRRLRDYFQRRGYFDVKVDHLVQMGNESVTIQYTVLPGPSRKVEKVTVDGNRYFDTTTLMDLLSVHAANVLDRHGLYSQALVAADVSALQSLYENNGFAHVKVTPETSTPETVEADNSPPAAAASRPAAIAHTEPLAVTYHIAEGPQLHVGALKIEGNQHLPADVLAKLLNTTSGQLLSPRNLAGDHDTLVTEYYSRGFDHVAVSVAQQDEAADASKVDVTFSDSRRGNRSLFAMCW